MPRYEYSAGGSHKFWEIEVHGSEYTVTYGRIGTVGQTSTKSFADAATAKAKADAAAKSKAAKGYVLVAAEAVASERAEVEERLVVADRLQEEGDPRGRLIPLHHGMATKSGKDRSELKKQETALLQEHAGALLGPLSEEAAGACAKVERKLG